MPAQRAQRVAGQKARGQSHQHPACPGGARGASDARVLQACTRALRPAPSTPSPAPAAPHLPPAAPPLPPGLGPPTAATRPRRRQQSPAPARGRAGTPRCLSGSEGGCVGGVGEIRLNAQPTVNAGPIARMHAIAAQGPRRVAPPPPPPRSPEASFSRLSPSISTTSDPGPPARRSTAVTASASVEASMALKSAPCCQRHPISRRPSSTRRRGVDKAAEATTTRKANAITCSITCARVVWVGGWVGRQPGQCGSRACVHPPPPPVPRRAATPS